jgi:Flp pilus assembly secretin CpaC
VPVAQTVAVMPLTREAARYSRRGRHLNTTNTFPPRPDHHVSLQGSAWAPAARDDPYAEGGINLLVVEGEEQVMLRVSVAEVQRC